jgi:HEAT repeat protein
MLYHNGKTWHDPLDDGDTQTEHEAAADAIRHIGSNAVPWLLKWMQYEQPAWKEGIEDFRNRHRLTWITVDRAELRARGAHGVFEVLGPRGRAAAPELTRLLNQPVEKISSYRALYALSYLGADALNPLMSASTNASLRLRCQALTLLGKLGTNARPAIPLLFECFQDKDWNVASAAAAGLGQMKFAPDTIVPFLTEALRGRYREYAAMALRQFGEQSRPALPALLELCSDPEDLVRQEATNAIREIAPELLKKPKRQ